MKLLFPLSLFMNRQLLGRLVEREVASRYRGSVLGWSWSILSPLLMLAVYTFVFSEIFQSRWGNLDDSGPLGFALNLFAGLIVFNLFSECVSQAPTLILSNSNYVTKVIFPLELLGAVSVASACFHALTSLLVLAVFQLIVIGGIPATMLTLPFVWLPLVGGSLAMSWILSALGVYLRDIGQLVTVSLSMLMFLSAVFYPLSALPVRWQPLLRLNPLVLIIEETRKVAILGKPPGLMYIVVGSCLAIVLCELSFRAFRKSQRGFADVL